MVRESIVALILAAAPAPFSSESTIDADLARERFREASALCARDGGSLWGISLEGPMLLVDARTRQAAANRPAPAPGGGLEDAGVGVWTGTLPATLPVANTALEWAGARWTMILWPLPEDRAARGALMMHELFHRVQPALGHAVAETDNSHLDSHDGRLWLRLELRALASALEAAGDTDRAAAAADALHFRDRRQAPVSHAAAERALEFNEGLAEYTGLRLCGLDAPGQRTSAVAALRAGDGKESYVRSFAYLTGPAYGLLLDELSPSWRRGVTAATGLDGPLRLAIGYRAPEDLLAAAQERGAAYGLETVTAQEEQRRANREAWAAEQLRRYVDGPVLVLPMREPRFSFDPNRVKPLDDHGSVYEGIEVTDRWGTLGAPAGALWTADFTLRVPAPEKATRPHLGGDGWSLDLADGWALVPGARPGDWTIQHEE